MSSYKHIDKDEILAKYYTQESLTEEYKEDIAFLERIKAQITINGQLPFNVPIDNLPQIIHNCVEWYFRHCEDASEEKWLVIPRSALVMDNNYNTEVKLPWRILSVNEVHLMNDNALYNTMPYSQRQAFRYETLFMTSSAYSSLNVGGYGINSISNLYSANFYDHIGDAMLNLYAMGDLHSIFARRLRNKYNRNSRTLRFLTGVPESNVAINVTERLNLQDLYYDDRFIRYVVGHALVNIGFVLGVFEFKMPGNIEIDKSIYAERGQALIDEVREELENDDDSPIMLFS